MGLILLNKKSLLRTHQLIVYIKVYFESWVKHFGLPFFTSQTLREFHDLNECICTRHDPKL